MPFASLLFRKPRLRRRGWGWGGRAGKRIFVEARLSCFFIISIVNHTTLFLRGASPMGTGLPRAAQGTRQQQAKRGIQKLVRTHTEHTPGVRGLQVSYPSVSQAVWLLAPTKAPTERSFSFGGWKGMGGAGPGELEVTGSPPIGGSMRWGWCMDKLNT